MNETKNVLHSEKKKNQKEKVKEKENNRMFRTSSRVDKYFIQ